MEIVGASYSESASISAHSYRQMTVVYGVPYRPDSQSRLIDVCFYDLLARRRLMILIVVSRG